MPIVLSSIVIQDFVTETEYMESNPKQPDRKRRRTESAAWSSSEEQAVSVSAVQSSICGDLQVGSRCYAKFTNGQWYWGNVANVTGSGKYKLFSVSQFELVELTELWQLLTCQHLAVQVKFDDGDFLEGLPTYAVVSEKEYNKEMGNLQVPADSEVNDLDCDGTDAGAAAPRSFTVLRKERCRCCSMCSKEDCGKCQSCVTNQRQTDTGKEVCLHKVCFPAKSLVNYCCLLIANPSHDH